MGELYGGLNFELIFINIDSFIQIYSHYFVTDTPKTLILLVALISCTIQCLFELVLSYAAIL